MNTGAPGRNLPRTGIIGKSYIFPVMMGNLYYARSCRRNDEVVSALRNMSLEQAAACPGRRARFRIVWQKAVRIVKVGRPARSCKASERFLTLCWLCAAVNGRCSLCRNFSGCKMHDRLALLWKNFRTQISRPSMRVFSNRGLFICLFSNP